MTKAAAMKRFQLFLVLLMLASLGCYGCGRVPSQTRAQHMVKHHLKKYGKKYKTSEFGQFPVARVEIAEIAEVQHDEAEVDALAILKGDADRIPVRFLVQKKALGWRVMGWERLTPTPAARNTNMPGLIP